MNARWVVPVVIIAMMSSACVQLHAQMREELGATLLGIYALHDADMRALPGVPSCCPSYGSGSGVGGTLAASYALPFTWRSRLVVRAGLTLITGNLERDESVIVAGGEQGVFRHSVETSVTDLTLEPLYRYTLIDNLFVAAGARIGVTVGSTFSQKETIIAPSSGTFPGGQRTRNVVDGEPIPNVARFSAGLVGVLGLDLPLRKDQQLRLVPEISYVLPLTDLVSGVDWTVAQIRVGVSVALRLGPYDPLRPGASATPSTVPTVVPVLATDDRTRRLIIEAELANGSRTDSARVVIDETMSTLMTPLLSHIYFDDGRADIPSRYARAGTTDVASFSEHAVNTVDRLTTYHHLLDILGSRMQRDPSSTVTIVGCRSDGGLDNADATLGRRRAEAIQDHLVRVWGIATSRIRVVGRDLPERPSTAGTAEAAQENRRAELNADPPSLLSPVVTRDTVRTVEPRRIWFRVEGTDATVADWHSAAYFSADTVWQQRGRGPASVAIPWDVTSTFRALRGSADSIDVAHRLYMPNATNSGSSARIPVIWNTLEEKRKSGVQLMEIERYGLMLFRIRSADISAEDEENLRIIRAAVVPGSRVTIVGYTDRLGDAGANETLAARRARAVADALRLPPDVPVTVRSEGNAALYDPTIPEGRAYTRTVEVIIESPAR